MTKIIEGQSEKEGYYDEETMFGHNSYMCFLTLNFDLQP